MTVKNTAALTAKWYIHQYHMHYTLIVIHNYCTQWFSDPTYCGTETNHLKRTGRPVTPPQEWKKWDISFPETDDEES